MIETLGFFADAFVDNPFLIVVASSILSAVLTGILLRFLRTRQFGKTIREDGPDHQAKAGTPTMGGLGMLVMVGIMLVGTHIGIENGMEDKGIRLNAPVFLAMIITFIGFVSFGLLDDMAGLARKNGEKDLGIGLRARDMLSLQMVLAGFVTAFIAWTSPFYLPIISEDYQVIAKVAGAVLLVIIIVGTANGVNLSDGLDGLAAGLLFIAFASSAVSFWVVGPYTEDFIERANSNPSAIELQWDDSHVSIPHDDGRLSDLESLNGGRAFGYETLFLRMGMFVIALVAAGACLGFLFHNRFPAKVFMGNVASMGLGVTFAMTHILSGTWWLIPIIGAVFVAEVISDLIQIGYFKYSGGVRVFRMAPLHHHYEKGGMPEQQVVRRFLAAGLVSGIAGIALAWFVA